MGGHITGRYKILMVIGQFSPITGGAEKQCLKLGKELIKKGHEVKVLTSWQRRTLPKREAIEGVDVQRVWYPVIRIMGRRILSLGFLCRFIMIFHIYRDLRYYDLVHVHQGFWPAFSAVVAAWLRRKPVICKIGNSGERFDLLMHKKEGLWSRIEDSFMVRRIDKFVWTSRAICADLESYGVCQHKLVCIPNGVELQELRSSHEASGKTGFIFAGSLTPKKNVDLIIEAIRSLGDSYRRNMALDILGEGPEKKRLAELANKCDLSETVNFRGNVADVYDFLRRGEVFVLVSSAEGLSNAALEAMSCGLALVLSRVGGNNDLVESSGSQSLSPDNSLILGSNGILVRHNTVGCIAQAMAYLIDHRHRLSEMGRRSHEIIAERYSLEKVAAQYESLYNDCLGGPVSSPVPN